MWKEAQESKILQRVFRKNFADIEMKIVSCIEEHSRKHRKYTLKAEHIARIILATYQGLVLQMGSGKDIDPKNTLGHMAYLIMNQKPKKL